MSQVQRIVKPDILGVFISTLCAIHCMATPLIFLAKAGTSAVHVETPFWYKSFDYLFLGISFIAVAYAVKNSNKQWIKIALWTTWSLLLLGIVNELVEAVHLPEAAVYTPALVLAGLHLYNRKYCQCADENCCAVKS